MSLYYDEKGKFFTDYITKDTIRAVLQTATNRIEGVLYIRAGERLSDMLNRSEKFIPLTNVHIYDLSGNHLYSGDFVAVNVDLIIWLKPEDEPKKDGDLS